MHHAIKIFNPLKIHFARKFLPLRLLYLSGAQLLLALTPAVQEAGPWGPPFPGQRGDRTGGAAPPGQPPPRSGAHATALRQGTWREGTSGPPSPGKGEPEPTRRAPAAHRRHPRGEAGTVPPAGERRRGGGGSHAGGLWPPANLGASRAPGGRSRGKSPPGKAAAAAAG